MLGELVELAIPDPLLMSLDSLDFLEFNREENQVFVMASRADEFLIRGNPHEIQVLAMSPDCPASPLFQIPELDKSVQVSGDEHFPVLLSYLNIDHALFVSFVSLFLHKLVVVFGLLYRPAVDLPILAASDHYVLEEVAGSDYVLVSELKGNLVGLSIQDFGTFGIGANEDVVLVEELEVDDFVPKPIHLSLFHQGEGGVRFLHLHFEDLAFVGNHEQLEVLEVQHYFPNLVRIFNQVLPNQNDRLVLGVVLGQLKLSILIANEEQHSLIDFDALQHVHKPQAVVLNLLDLFIHTQVELVVKATHQKSPFMGI